MASEKYHAYLCSREWGLKTEAVKQRSGGVCERCHRNPGAAVHHKTYARIYNELLTDLIHLCEGCHDFTHGKSDDDPAAVKLEPVRVYMAGAVRCSDSDDYEFINRWRDDIFESSDGEQAVGSGGRYEPSAGRFVYGGPEITGSGHGILAEYPIAERCFVQVEYCDVLFAWIDGEETVGAVAEIGLARGKRIPVFVAFANAELAHRFYFVAQFADCQCVVSSVVAAWKVFVEWCETENRSWWDREAGSLKCWRPHNRHYSSKEGGWRDRELACEYALAVHITHMRVDLGVVKER